MNKILKIEYEKKSLDGKYIPFINTNNNIKLLKYVEIFEYLFKMYNEIVHMFNGKIINYNIKILNNIINNVIIKYKLYEKFDIIIINVPINYNNNNVKSNKINYNISENKTKLLNELNLYNKIEISTFYNNLNNEENINLIIFFTKEIMEV
jgi:hypothetical protein